MRQSRQSTASLTTTHVHRASPKIPPRQSTTRQSTTFYRSPQRALTQLLRANMPRAAAAAAHRRSPPQQPTAQMHRVNYQLQSPLTQLLRASPCPELLPPQPTASINTACPNAAAARIATNPAAIAAPPAVVHHGSAPQQPTAAVHRGTISTSCPRAAATAFGWTTTPFRGAARAERFPSCTPASSGRGSGTCRVARCPRCRRTPY